MIAPNTLLQNRYLVLKQIGQGGMGAVYIATDQRFGSTVALKETFFDDPGLRKAFEREARLLNHLRHPALPRVSDHFLEDEGQFLVMEYIAGDDLSEKLKDRGGAFPPSEVLNWADQLLDALDYLHTQEPSVIHRDIKPQNLKLTARNAIVLLDFGLAKGTATTQTKVTATGSVFGYSRNYAPLEQIQGAGTDPRSDLYSLAATLYHLVTGVTPPDALTRATAVLNGQPDPLLPANEVHAQVTPAVAEVLTQAMAQNASQRPQTASAMRDAMREAVRQGHSVTRDTNALLVPPTNVYEQETQLMFAATPLTSTGEAADEAGIVKAASPATALNSTSSAGASTSKNNSESVVTKVATSQSTTTKSQPRKHTLAIAASAIVLMVVAAAVYTFTRSNNTPTTTPPAEPAQQNVQIEPTVPETSNPNDQQPTKIVIIEKGEDTAPRETTPTKPSKPNTQTAPVPKPERAEANEGDNNPPVPPDPNGITSPQRPTRKIMRPGDPQFEEAMRQAEEARREGEEARREGAEARRAAQEQRRPMIIRQRELLRRQRQRQRQMQQP